MTQASYTVGSPKDDRNGPVDEAAGSANSYLFLAALNAAAALPLAVAPHTVSIPTIVADMFAFISLMDPVSRLWKFVAWQ